MKSGHHHHGNSTTQSATAQHRLTAARSWICDEVSFRKFYLLSPSCLIVNTNSSEDDTWASFFCNQENKGKNTAVSSAMIGCAQHAPKSTGCSINSNVRHVFTSKHSFRLAEFSFSNTLRTRMDHQPPTDGHMVTLDWGRHSTTSACLILSTESVSKIQTNKNGHFTAHFSIFIYFSKQQYWLNEVNIHPSFLSGS